MATLSEVSYLDLVKAFCVCLKIEEDGSLTSTVKGTQIKFTYGLLESLFGVGTIDHSGVHTVDIQAKGLGIVGPEFRLKDAKIYINQLNAFNCILHFIICQILVPRSATFSTCTKADSDMMFWAIQNQSINMVEVIIERMKFSSARVWDKKSKLNVSLPYEHLLTKVFQHFGINLSVAVLEKMGQAIRSRNLKKSGFSLVARVWTKTSVVEGEAIIGEAQKDQQAVVVAEVPAGPGVQEEPAAVAVAAPTVQVAATDIRECVSDIQEEQAAGIIQKIVEDISSSERRIEDIPPKHLEPVEQLQVITPATSMVGSVLRRVLDSIPSTQSVQEVVNVEEAVASGHIANVVMEEAPIQGGCGGEENFGGGCSNDNKLHLFLSLLVATSSSATNCALEEFQRQERIRVATNISHGLFSFLSNQESSSTVGKLMQFTFMSAIWEIWYSRNRARFQEQGMSAKHIVNRTMLSVLVVSSNFKTQQLLQPWSKALKKNGDNRLQKKITAPMVIKWMHPPVGRLKLNVDGAFKSATGSAGGGGILPDHNGRCICAFAKKYQGTISALDAEARALRDGLAMCCSKGFLDIMVETDSLMLTQSITGQSQRPWVLTCIFQEMAEINHKLTTQIQHIPREANQTAHHLACYGCSTDQTYF
ncbi:hypothetical protein Taro_044209 [Colocasia esculenta]|uniref:RNase H type-1 domain-containing protein n=1 Tax=Colocasia esculenta TaxID=4460 RepID=A0A843WLA0_COLES|nr:hypothetical protein [Colocasia esculenta]